MNFTKTNVLSRKALKPENFAIPAVNALLILDGTNHDFNSRREVLDTIVSDCINSTRFVRIALHKTDHQPLTDHMGDLGITIARCAGIIVDKDYDSGEYFVPSEARKFIDSFSSEEDLKNTLISNWKSNQPVDLVARWKKAHPRKNRVNVIKKSTGKKYTVLCDSNLTEKYSMITG